MVLSFICFAMSISVKAKRIATIFNWNRIIIQKSTGFWKRFCLCIKNKNSMQLRTRLFTRGACINKRKNCRIWCHVDFMGLFFKVPLTFYIFLRDTGKTLMPKRHLSFLCELKAKKRHTAFNFLWFLSLNGPLNCN